MSPEQWVTLRARLVGEMDAARDSLRFYFLGREGRRKIEHLGSKPVVDLDAPLIV